MIKTVHKKFFKGFTLIELLIVIAILGILAAAVLVAINPAKRTNQARDAGRKNDIGSLATELQAYYTTPGQGFYPTSLNILTSAGGLKQLPKDPKYQTDYSYTINNSTLPTEAGIYSTLDDPSGATGIWCWRSTNNAALEYTVGGCTL
jgi:prepilin-type N-terminal cleavage/methylation domain-containing protein